MVDEIEKKIKNKYGDCLPDFSYEEHLPVTLKTKLITTFFESDDMKYIINKIEELRQIKIREERIRQEKIKRDKIAQQEKINQEKIKQERLRKEKLIQEKREDLLFGEDAAPIRKCDFIGNYKKRKREENKNEEDEKIYNHNKTKKLESSDDINLFNDSLFDKNGKVILRHINLFHI